MKTSVVWFRQDLRLRDNPALQAAVQDRGKIIPLFIWSPGEEGPWPAGAASRWWLHQSLKRLDGALHTKNSRLIIRRGKGLPVLLRVIRETGADAVYWNRRYEPAPVKRDRVIERQLRGRGLKVETHNASLLFEPWEIQNGQGRPYKVFTPFWNRCLSHGSLAEPLPVPRDLPAPGRWPASLTVEELGLEPRAGRTKGIGKAWCPGEQGAMRALKKFLGEAVFSYKTGRDRPGRAGTSRLSPHLHFGEISPRTVWHALSGKPAAGPYRRQLGWREFANHLLYNFPDTPLEAFRPGYDRFPWQEDPVALKAWQKGLTGYPLVDAGMRELWSTGWMHNRVRMIAASFLVKHLLIPWQAGAKWFWDTLADADLANNTLGWQWAAGSGADAAPYFRIFNPVRQGERFDPEGDYVRRWIPELARLPWGFIHKPWEAPPEVCARAGIRPGKDYPLPIVDPDLGRKRALLAYSRFRKKTAG